jgi:hypothetical protein
MNKLALVFVLIMVGCAQNQPTREVLNCQSENIKDSSTLFIGGSRNKDQIDCRMVRVPLAPKSTPLSVDPKLIDKSIN